MVSWSSLLGLLSVFAWQGDALAGFDLALATSTSTFTCLKNAGNSIGIVRGYRSSGSVDSNARTNIANAWAAGLSYVDVYAFPCRGMDAEEQMNDLIDELGSSNYGIIWLDLEYNPKSSCDWAGHSDTDNCNYAKELVAAVKARGKKPGIYSSYGQWEMMFGSSSACKVFTDLPLWYAHYDNVASFSDWTRLPFGGWTNPVMKQYVGDTTSCSAGIDKNIEFGFYTSSAYPGNGQTSCTNSVSQGGVRVTFPSGAVLTSISTCDTKYADPNRAGTYVFSIASSGASTRLSTNFKLGEFQSPDDADGIRVSPYLITCLQNVRTNMQQSVYVKAAYLTTTYNSAQSSSASESYHLSGTAANIYISGDVLKLAKSVICQCRDYFVDNGKDIGLALADTFLHVDMRSSFSTWVEAGSQYTSSQWLSYLSSSYSSCGGRYTIPKSSVSVSDSANTINAASSSSCVRFPSGACLVPVYYTDSKYKDPNNSGTKLFSASDSGLNTRLSNNFVVKEFVCKDGSDGFRLAPELVECLQIVRETLGTSVTINSGYRTVTHNKNVGGATYSRHMSGTGADSSSPAAGLWGYANAVICKCRQLFRSEGQEIGLGLDASYIHVDMRPYYSYWIYSGAPLNAEDWNSYIQKQWAKCSSGSSSSSRNQDYNEDGSHNDIDTYESYETGTVNNDEEESSSSSDDNNSAVVISVVVIISVFALLVAYLLYRRHHTRKQVKHVNESDVPLNNYVHLQDTA